MLLDASLGGAVLLLGVLLIFVLICIPVVIIGIVLIVLAVNKKKRKDREAIDSTGAETSEDNK